MMEFFSYYEILGVEETAEPEAIKSAFRTLSMKYHPDRVPETLKKKSEEIFKMISEAYETLSDPEKRKKYDENLKNVKAGQTADRGNDGGPAVVNVDRDHFKFENLKPRVLISDIFIVLNQGGETLVGAISADKPWVKLSESVINTPDYQEIEITIDTASLPPGFSDSAVIDVDTNGGRKTVSVDISMEPDFVSLIHSYWLVLKSFVSPYRPFLESFLRTFGPRILGVVFLLLLSLICSLKRPPEADKTVPPPEAVAEIPGLPKPEVPKPEIPRPKIPKPPIPKSEDLEGAWYGQFYPCGTTLFSLGPRKGRLEGRIFTAGIIGKVRAEIEETGEIVFKIEGFEDVFVDLTGRPAGFSETISASFSGRLKGNRIESEGKQSLSFSRISDPDNPRLALNALIGSLKEARCFKVMSAVYEADFETVFEAALEVLEKGKEKIRFESREEKLIVTYATEHSSLLGDYIHKYVILFRDEGRATETIVLQFRYEKRFGSACFSIASDSSYATDNYFFIPLEKKLTQETERNDFVIQRSYFRKSGFSKAIGRLF